MFTLNPLLAALCVAVLPIFFFATGKAMKRQNYYQARLHNSRRRMNGRLTDSLAALRVIKAFAKENTESRRFRGVAVEAADAYKTVTVFNNTVMPSLNILMYCSTLMIWAVGGWMTITSRMTYGFLTAFVAYAAIFNNPMQSMVNMMESFSACINAMQRLFEIYEAAPSVKEAKNPLVLPETF